MHSRYRYRYVDGWMERYREIDKEVERSRNFSLFLASYLNTINSNAILFYVQTFQAEYCHRCHYISLPGTPSRQRNPDSCDHCIFVTLFMFSSFSHLSDRDQFRRLWRNQKYCSFFFLQEKN